jgi:hypothetical protein
MLHLASLDNPGYSGKIFKPQWTMVTVSLMGLCRDRHACCTESEVRPTIMRSVRNAFKLFHLRCGGFAPIGDDSLRSIIASRVVLARRQFLSFSL